MRLTIRHTTRYRYDEPVAYALQQARLRPMNNPMQKVIDWDLQITGGTSEVRYVDHFGNNTDLISADPSVTSLDITATGVVDTVDTTGVLGKSYGSAPLWFYLQHTGLTAPDAAITAMADDLCDTADPLSSLHSLSETIRNAVVYDTSPTRAATTAAEALAGGRGVCQDHAQIFVSAARAMNVPARYVSGYLMMNDRVDQDASHAWAEAHVPGMGWVGFDVSNVISPDERYVRLATGLDYTDASPLSGIRMGGAMETMQVALQVQQ